MNKKLYEFKAAITSDPLKHAFSARQPMIPWLSMKPIPEKDVDPTWQKMRSASVTGATVAYVHIPFCANHCLFCGFYRNAARGNFSTPYADRLIEEIETESKTRLVSSAPIQALYLGGGTPTELQAEDLFRILSALRINLPLAKDCEITVEGRARSITKEKIAACIEGGATRISIGVQSFNTEIRQRLGRFLEKDALIHLIRSVVEQSKGRADVVCDLIYGLPGQTMETWKHDLDIISELGLSGVDLYCLTVLHGSPLRFALEKNKDFPRAGTLPEQAERYEYGVRFFKEHHWQQISAAHWRSTPRERNVYNLLIKAGANCHGFGSGAGGSSGSLNYTVASVLPAYLNNGPEKPIGSLFTAGNMYRSRARVTDGLERGILDLAHVHPQAMNDFLAIAQPLVDQWQEAGLLNQAGTAIRLTLAGQFWHTNLAAGLHAALNILDNLTESSAKTTSITQTTMNDETKKETLDAIRTKLEKNSDGILEMIAETNGVSTRDVTACLPESMRTITSGEHFAEVMENLSTWEGEVMVIIHTKDGVFETSSVISKGKFARGFYNFEHDGAFRGHIRADRCKEIFFVRRPFMGTETCSIQFFNEDGDAMFKIFAGRDADHDHGKTKADLRKDHIEKFETLRTKLAKELQAA